MSVSALERNIIERVNMGDMLRRRARSESAQEALVAFENGERKSFTFFELNERVNKLARGLIGLGLEQYQKLAFMSANNLDYITVLFACYKLGVVAVPINFLQNPDDIRYNIEHSESSLLIYDPLLEDLALACVAGNDAIVSRVNMSAAAGKGDVSMQQLIADQDDGSELNDRVIADRDVAHMIYTSGTTSRPKGVVSSHLALYFSAMNGAISLGGKRHDSSLVVLPLFHCAALSLMYTTLNLGGKAVIMPAFDAATAAELIQSERIANAALLPMMWKAMLTVEGVDKSMFDSFTTGVYAMAPMDQASLDAVRELLGCEMHLGSGQTEFTPSACIFYDNSPQEHENANYWGVPCNAVDQAVIDDQGNEVAQGEVGEICWRGPQVMNGYFKNPEATAEASAFGWHHSGDLGMIDKYGQLVFVDRKKDTIKSGGENVSSIKVEQVILGMEGVALAAVFGVPHERWFEAVCAAVQLQPGIELTEEEVIDLCKQHLGGFEVPKKVVFVDSFEFTGTGKIRKVELRQQFADLFS